MQDLDGIQVSISAEMNAYLAAMSRMTQAAEQAASRVQRAFSSVNAQIDRQGAPGIEPLKQLDVALDRTATNAERAGKRMEASFGGFGFGSGLKGIAIQMAGFAAIMGTMAAGNQALKTMGDFERSIALLGAVSESSAKQVAPLRAQAVQLGADTSRSATDVARLQVELGKLGWSLDRIKTSTPGILNLSIAGDMDAGEAAKLVGSTLNNFKMQASQAQEVADVLAQASIKSAADVSDFATSMDYASGIAASLGRSLKDAAAEMAALSDAGLAPSTIGTSYRSLLGDFAMPTQHAREFFKSIKLETRDATGALRPLADLIDDLTSKLKARNMSLTTMPAMIFEQDSLAAMTSLANRGTGHIRELRGEMDKAAGAADKLAKVYTEGLQGALERLSGAWDSFAVAVGDSGFLATATTLVNGLASALGGLADVTTSLNSDGGFFGKGGLYDAATTYLYDAAKGQIGAAGTIKERQAAYDQYLATRGQQTQQDAAGRQASQIAYGSWLFGRAGQPKGPAAPPSATIRPPVDPMAQMMAAQMMTQMRRDVRELETLAAAAQKGADAYIAAQQSIARAQIVRDGGEGAGRLYDQQVKAQQQLNSELERTASLQAEVDAALMAEIDAKWAYNDEMTAALQAEVDAYFQIQDAKQQIIEATRQTVEDEQALAAAAQQGAAAYERMRTARDLMRQNKDITQEEADAMAAQVEAAREKTNRAVDDMQRLKQAAADVGQAFASAFETAIMQGGKLSDVLKGLARDILAIVLRQTVTNPLAQAVTAAVQTVFGGGKALGGPVAAGVPYLVGEKGPELYVPQSAGTIIANSKLGGGGAPVINQSWSIDARGADAAAVARLERAFASDRAIRKTETEAIVRNALGRRAIK